MSFEFPRTHLIAIALICAGLWAFGFSDFKEPYAPEATSVVPKTLLADSPQKTKSTAATATTASAVTQPVTTAQAIEHTIQRGENLAVVRKHGFSAPELHAMANSKPHGKRLQNILPGKTIRFTLDKDGLLAKLSYEPSPLEVLEFQRGKDGYSGKLTRRQPDINKVYRTGRINKSLFLSAQRSGLSDARILPTRQDFSMGHRLRTRFATRG